MNKAEKIAVEKYPHGTFDGELGDSLRAACAVGYMQAERDLADAFQAEYAKELARADSLTGEDGFKKFSESVKALVEAVEGYIAPKKGDKYVFRGEVLEKCNKVKKLLGE